jgi:hypothetical protein
MTYGTLVKRAGSETLSAVGYRAFAVRSLGLRPRLRIPPNKPRDLSILRYLDLDLRVVGCHRYFMA